jgi:hypothetical protein
LPGRELSRAMTIRFDSPVRLSDWAAAVPVEVIETRLIRQIRNKLAIVLGM